MEPGERYQLEYLQSLAERLRSAGHGSRGDLVAEGAAHLGISKPTLYTRLRGVGFTTGRKLRADKGDSRVTEEEVKAVAALLANRRANGKRISVVKDAIDIALANGLLGERVSEATILRLMRRHNCHPAQLDRPTPHQDLRSAHPNDVWQLDASTCVLFYLPKASGLSVMDERKYNARKPLELARTLKERVLRYIATDHTTGALHLRYVLAAGETERGLFEFLFEGMSQRDGFVMHGVPHQLVWDAGAANRAHGIQNLLRALGVRQWPHLPGNPRAKGQVEGMQQIVERRFEARLAFMHVRSIEELNHAADKWCRDFNATQVHSRHGHTRWALWQTIRADQLRLCPPRSTCEALLHTKPEQRTVAGNLTVSFRVKGHDRADYSVAHVPDVRVGDRLSLIVNPYSAPAIYVITRDAENVERFIECTPLAIDQYGFRSDAAEIGKRYARPADTVVDDARKDLGETLWGSRDRDAAERARKAGRVAMGGAVDPLADITQRSADLPTFLQRRGTELNVPNPAHVELKPLDLVEALFEMRARLGRSLKGRETEAVRAWFPNGVPAEDLDGLQTRLEQLPAAGAAPVPSHEMPRLVAVK